MSSSDSEDLDTIILKTFHDKKTKERPKRTSKPTAKIRETKQPIVSKWGIVKCAQTGKLHSVSSEYLYSKDIEPVQENDLQPGAELFMELDQQIFPVTYVKDKMKIENNGVKRSHSDTSKGKASKRSKLLNPTPLFSFETTSKSIVNDKADSDDDTTVNASTKDKADSDDTTVNASTKGKADKAVVNTKRILEKAKIKATTNAVAKDASNGKQGKADKAAVLNPISIAENVKGDEDSDVDNITDKENQPPTPMPSDPKQQMELLHKHLVRVEKKIDHLTKLLEKNEHEGKKEEEVLIKGINVRRIYAPNPYVYGLQLMDAFFTREELAGSLMFENKSKSSKKPLDKERVSKVFQLIEEKFHDDPQYNKHWNVKKFIAKGNQKCRDALRVIKVEETDKEVDDADLVES